MTKTILFSAIMAIAFSATAQTQTQTGTLTCVLVNNMKTASAQAKILQNADGTGGVAEVSATDGNATCEAQAVSKFGIKKLFHIAITKNGVTAESRLKHERGNISLTNEADCNCLVK